MIPPPILVWFSLLGFFTAFLYNDDSQFWLSHVRKPNWRRSSSWCRIRLFLFALFVIVFCTSFPLFAGDIILRSLLLRLRPRPLGPVLSCPRTLCPRFTPTRGDFRGFFLLARDCFNLMALHPLSFLRSINSECLASANLSDARFFVVPVFRSLPLLMQMES